MVDTLIASLDDIPRFDADGLLPAARVQWPSMQWAPSTVEFPELGDGEFTVEAFAQSVTEPFPVAGVSPSTRRTA